MKRTFTFWAVVISMMVLSIPRVYAGNMFVVGAKWVELQKSAPGIDNDKTWLNVEYIDGVEMIDGRECLRVMQKSDGEGAQRMTYLQVRDDKVYFMTNLANKEWSLLYDFGLQPGESAEVAMRTAPLSQPTNIDKAIVKCVDVKKDPLNPDVEIMEVQIFHGDLFGRGETGYWLKGIGATCGLMYNLYYGMDGGKGSRLIEFSTPENGVIYDNPLDNVVETIAGAIEKESDCYALLGRKIENPAKGEMYIRAGRLRIER